MEQTVDVVENVVQTAPAVAPQGSSWGMVLYLCAVFAIIFFFMVRPNKKRMAEYQKMLDSLQVGNRRNCQGCYCRSGKKRRGIC